MEIRNLLRIIFRIFGLYAVIHLVFTFLPQQFTYIINADLLFPFDVRTGIFQTWIYLILIVALILAVFYVLIINPDLIINKIKPQNFLEEKINFEKLNAENLLQIAILSIGILLLFDAIPELVNKLFILSKVFNMNKQLVEDINTLNIKSEIATASVKILVGLIFIIFQYQIGKTLYRQNIEK
ncbi:hypothetical protein ACM44_09105 [Chryseobacterium koreense CCUG 49689]|uniref:Uncharacterized protein n=1 Tax=Chryseobacterium koreense CCUG 49689 TaxID=1304281 RepID=A0A0J7IYN1_9FLAO|nr:hypothetical protein ACM44_09105 [Chryseobacterium koreense CCUG 49689]